MSQAARPLSLTPGQALPGLVRGPLTPAQQLEALRRVQAQADQRVKLGTQLFKAAQAHASQQQAMLQQLKQEQDKLREDMQQDVARSLRQYDQWMAKMDEGFTDRIHQLEARISALHEQWAQAQQRIDGLMRRAEVLLDQSRGLLDPGRSRGPSPNMAPAPSAASSGTATMEPPPAGTMLTGEADQLDLANEEPIYSRLLDKLRDRPPVE